MNEPTDAMEQPGKVNDALTVSPYPGTHTASLLTSQAGCTTCGASGAALDPNVSGVGMPAYVYAIGQVEARFPNLAAEKEFAQATGRTDTAGKTDQQAFHAVLSQRENRYLVRQLCWVLSIQGLETYLLLPRDPADIDLLVEAIRPAPIPMTSMSSLVYVVPSPRR